MVNRSLTKLPMPEQDPNQRNRNFLEVTLGYTKEMAIEEAQRCLQCKNKPCVAGCPVNVRIPDFIGKVAEGDLQGAYEIIATTNALPSVCGRVCPQESQCEGLCIRGKKGEPVAIGRLERLVGDHKLADKAASDSTPVAIKPNGKKVAIVGSGPAGLTCAGDLAKLGYKVTVFEAFHTAGGVLIYGIPEFRLPKDIVRKEIDNIKKLGVEIRLNMVIGKVWTLDELLTEEGFEAIFVGSGAGLPSFMNIPGENLNGVYSANEFLTRVNMMKAYRFPEFDTPVKIGKAVAVVGGGNVAMDAARCAKRLGAEQVYIVYRRSQEEMPARVEEVHHAKEEGIIFKLLTSPIQIVDTGKGWVKGLECVEMELGEPDASGRRKPVAKPNSAHMVEVETVVMAIGQSPNPLIASTTSDLAVQKWGGIIADEGSGATSKARVYAGGDAVTGAATVILAMGAGKRAAVAIDQMLTGGC